MIKVGGEVDALCTKCELTLAHTIHAVVAGRPVKVECNTCHAVHRYRGTAVVGPGRSGPRAARPVREKVQVIGFDELLAAKRTQDARPYSPKQSFDLDQVVDHPTFGRGFVSAVRDAGKIEVTFRSEMRVLVHGRS